MQMLKQACIMFCRREEVSGEAQRVLRALPTKSTEKEGPKRMPSFPDMVAYVQEKVKLWILTTILNVYISAMKHFGPCFFLSCPFQAAQRIKTPAKYIVGTSTIPFNPSAFAEVNVKCNEKFSHSFFFSRGESLFAGETVFFSFSFLRLCSTCGCV